MNDYSVYPVKSSINGMPGGSGPKTLGGSGRKENSSPSSGWRMSQTSECSFSNCFSRRNPFYEKHSPPLLGLNGLEWEEEKEAEEDWGVAKNWWVGWGSNPEPMA